MNNNLKFMIAEASEMVLDLVNDTDEPDLYLTLERENVPIWDQLSTGRKIECIEYVRENSDNDNFGNSELCDPIHQSTAYFLVEWYKELSSEIFFDDLDFMMLEITPQGLATGAF